MTGDNGNDSILYFACGANMCRDVLVRRWEINPLSSEAACRKDFRLVFGKPGLPWLELGFAGIQLEPRASIHALTPESAKHVQAFKHVGHEVIVVSVEGTDQLGQGASDRYLRALDKRSRLADHPILGQPRGDIAPGYYSFLQGRHLVFYLKNPKGGIDVIGLPHVSMDTLNYFEP